MKVINVAGAIPNFVKIAPIIEQFNKCGDIQHLLVHTGQHYDDAMSGLFFEQLDIPKPDINLEVGSASHAIQTAEIMKAFEQIVFAHKPDVVLVVGDVNSTVACGLVAVKLGIKLAHVEAGLRSFDRSMPEEINRIVTDSISDFLFCTEQSGVDNLLREGVLEEKIFLVGNVMIDSLLKNKIKADQSLVLEKLSLDGDDYAALTLHRPANVDDFVVFSGILDALKIIQNDMQIIFPMHPRTQKNLIGSSLGERIKKLTNLRLVEPLGYLDFLKLMSGAKLVLTDSGGIQEETTILKIPCLTLRDNTERPVTVEIGTNKIVGTDPDKIIAAYKNINSGNILKSETPPLWDGRAAERIFNVLLEKIETERDLVTCG